MTFKSEVMEIISKRENRLKKVLESSKDYSEAKLLKELDFLWNDIQDAKKFAGENDKIQPIHDFGFVYTLMNEYSSYRAFAILSRVYQRTKIPKKSEKGTQILESSQKLKKQTQ